MIQMDAIRLEVREDLLKDKSDDPEVRKEFLKRAYERYQPLLQEGVCFIDDSSADRSWKQKPDDQYFQLKQFDYDFFIISMDLSKDFIRKLHAANKSASQDKLEEYFEDHHEFLRLYSNDVSVTITDDNFLDRMNVCEQAARHFIDSR